MFALSNPTDAPLLRGAIVLCLVAIPISLLLLGVDRRVLDYEALWLKPLKFYLSLAVHGITSATGGTISARSMAVAYNHKNRPVRIRGSHHLRGGFSVVASRARHAVPLQ